MLRVRAERDRDLAGVRVARAVQQLVAHRDPRIELRGRARAVRQVEVEDGVADGARVHPAPGRGIPSRGRNAEYPFHPTTTSTFVASPLFTASTACCNAATELAPPMWTVVANRSVSMPRLAASSSLEVKPGGGTMPSMSPTGSPASAIAVSAARSISSTGRCGDPRT